MHPELINQILKLNHNPIRDLYGEEEQSSAYEHDVITQRDVQVSSHQYQNSTIFRSEGV